MQEIILKNLQRKYIVIEISRNIKKFRERENFLCREILLVNFLPVKDTTCFYLTFERISYQ